MIFKKAQNKTLFKPSFGNKKGETDFYHVMIDNQIAGEIEIKPINKYGKPEILSAYTTIRGKGVGQLLVEKVLEIYLVDELYVMTTKESKPFWLKIGAKVENQYLCCFNKI